MILRGTDFKSLCRLINREKVVRFLETDRSMVKIGRKFSFFFNKFFMIDYSKV